MAFHLEETWFSHFVLFWISVCCSRTAGEPLIIRDIDDKKRTHLLPRSGLALKTRFSVFGIRFVLSLDGKV